jgi:NADPH2:quinone reductase
MLIRTGRYPWMPPLPYVPGNEMTGHIVDGNGTGLNDGQAVYVANWDNEYKGGFYAEYLAASAKAVRPLPPGTDLDRAAALSNYVVATCLIDYAVRFPFETLAVHGAAGGMGLALIELARLSGAKAIGIAGGAEKCALVRKRGADAVDHTCEDIVARLRELTGGRGADLICNHMAGDTLKRDLTMLAPFGLLVSYGALNGLPQSDLFRDMRAVVEACRRCAVSPCTISIMPRICATAPPTRCCACSPRRRSIRCSGRFFRSPKRRPRTARSKRAASWAKLF